MNKQLIFLWLLINYVSKDFCIFSVFVRRNNQFRDCGRSHKYNIAMNFEKKMYILDDPDTLSLASFTSRISNTEKLSHLIDQTNSSRIAKITKLILLIICPIAALIAMSGILLYISFDTANQIQKAEHDINIIIEIATLLETIQGERGTTALWIRLNDNRESMVGARLATDDGIRNLLSEHGQDKTQENIFLDVGSLEILLDIRNRVDNFELSLEGALIEYTDLLSELMGRTLSPTIPASGSIWRKLVSLNLINHASDSADVIRIIGEIFFLNCSLTPQFQEMLIEEEANLNAYLKLTHDYVYYSDIDKGFAEAIKSLQPHENELTTLTHWAHDMDDFLEQCVSYNSKGGSEQSNIWSHDMSSYLQNIGEVKKESISEVKTELTETLQRSRKGVIIYTTVTVVVIIASFVVGFIYAKNITKLTANIQKYAKKVRPHQTVSHVFWQRCLAQTCVNEFSRKVQNELQRKQ